MSLKTDNFKLYKYEDNDIGDLRFINDSMDIIDKGINPFYVATQSSTNVYKVTTGLNKTVLNDGYSIKVAIPSNSTGAVSITVDSVTVPVKKPNGNSVTNFKANGVYSLTYYNSVFILASGGMDDVNFSASDLLTGKTANNSNGEKVNGTMPNKGTVTQSLSVNGSLTLPSGYYDSIKVTQNIPNRGEFQMAGGIGSGDDYIALNKIPYGYYPQSSNGWSPEIRAKKSAVANHIGLTANKIVAGNTICGVTGTATIECTIVYKGHGGFKYESDGFKVKNPYYVSGSSKKCYLAIDGKIKDRGSISINFGGKFIETTTGNQYVTVLTDSDAVKCETFEGYGYWLRLN